ncbi:MAG: serine hydrolase [Gemmatimonadota bacterium]|nr:serine hydrolase [Gemmatimonadota bacterium]
MRSGRAAHGAVLALAISTAAPVGAQTLEGRIDAYLEPYLSTGNLSGSVLVARGGEILYSKGFGYANRETSVENSPGTGFHLASVSRVITSIATMLLDQRGLLSTDDPLSAYLPDWPRGDEIRVRHLLTLSAGFPNINELPGYIGWQRDPQTPESLVGRFRDLPLEFEPGTRSVHSNSNYNVLALLIERVSGLGFGDFLEREIFAPLGMTRTAHDGDAGRSESYWALGYAPSGLTDVTPVPDLDWSVKSGNGSIVSTTEDLFRLDRALASGSLLGPESLDEMFAEQLPHNGYGWFVRDRFGSREVYINGSSPGFGAYWGRSIDEDVTAIVLGNFRNTVPDAVGRDLIALVLDRPAEGPVMRSGRPDAALLAELAGDYVFGEDFYNPDGTVRVRVRDGQLFNGGDWLMPTTLGDHTFQHRRYWSILEFRRDADGRVVELRYDDFVGRRVGAP